MKGRVLVFGSINTDFVTYVAGLPAPGETVTGGRFESFPGGKGANQAVAAARSGADVEIYGCVGDDALGEARLRGLVEAGVSTRQVVVLPGVHSGIAQIIVDAGGENLIAVAPGANSRFHPENVTLPADAGGKATVALFQNEVPQTSTEAVIASCRAKGMTVVWNVAPAGRDVPPVATLAAVDFLICNHRELAGLAGDGDVEDLARQLVGRGAGSVIVTLGAEGSLLVTAGETHRQPAFPVTVVDTVGAGDCFCGYFAGSLASGMEVTAALRRASAAAALAATIEGAQTSMPLAAEVARLLASAEGGG
ncbi:MAG: ribokinase [Dehalococcoidales bacterium]